MNNCGIADKTPFRAGALQAVSNESRYRLLVEYHTPRRYTLFVSDSDNCIYSKRIDGYQKEDLLRLDL